MSKRWIFWLLVIGFIWVVVSRVNDLQKLIQTLSSGDLRWVMIAALVQVVYYVFFTSSYQSAFFTVDVSSRLIELIPVTLGSLFVNVVAPSGGAAGAALFVDDASKRGQSPPHAAAGTLLQLISDYSTFSLILVFSLAYLFIYHDLQTYEIIGALVLLVLTIALSGVLLVGLWRPDSLRRLLNWVQRSSGWLSGRLPHVAALADDWAEKNTAEFSEATSAIARHPWRLLATFSATFAAHLISIFSLYILFLAFHQPIQPGPLVAGYAMGVLFWVVSPIPQGIGVVEGVMALVYTSLGVPAEVATAVSLAFRGLTFWLPLVLGFVLLRRMKTFTAVERARAENWSVRVVAILTALMGVINVLSALTPSLAGRFAVLERYSPLAVRHGGHLTSALAGFALLLMARNLWRHKRVAWLLTLVILALSTANYLLRGRNYLEAMLSGALFIWLLSLRNHFHARSDPPSIQQGLRVLLGALVFTLIYGTLGFYLLDRHYSVNFGLGAALRQTIVMFTEFYNPGLQPITHFGRYFADSIYVVGAIALGYAVLMLLRPVLLPGPTTAAERARASQIVAANGRSSLARLALLVDKAYYFTPGGSLLAYTVKGRIAVCLGDPIGPEGDICNAIQAFLEYCSRNDWTACFYQAMPDYVPYYQQAGLETLSIGMEGIVDLSTFTLQGGANKHLRSAYRHLLEQGYRFEVHQPPISDGLLAVLREVSAEWLTTVSGSEKHFSLGWFYDDYIRGGPVGVVYSPQEMTVAFANINPEYQRNEISIDLMRRRKEVEPGTMDFLFVSLLNWAREAGYEALDLGLSAYAGVGENPEDPLIERSLHFIYENINQFYNYRGLHEFKGKFHPRWEPRYLVYPNTTSLAAVWLAITRANSDDEDFPWKYIPG